jgi:lysophospholipase L1-like esterase
MKKWIWIALGLSLFIAGIKAYPTISLLMANTPPEPVNLSQVNVLAELQEEAQKKGNLDYLILGDSVAMGQGSEKKQGYPALVAKQLKKEHIPLLLHNEGVSGRTSQQLLQALDAPTMQKKIRDAELISLTIGGNDLLKVALNEKDPVQAITEFGSIQKNYQRNLKETLSKVRSLNPDAPILLTSLYNPISPAEPYYDLSNTLLDKWNIGMKEVVYRFPSTLVIDVDEKLQAGKGHWLADAIHPNDRGYQRIADGILEGIREARSAAASTQ